MRGFVLHVRGVTTGAAAALLLAGCLPQTARVSPERVREAQESARQAIADELLTMLGAVVAGRRVKYLMMNAPSAALATIESLLPGLESPSVIPLAHDGMVAIHAVVGSRDVHGLLPRLRAAGASGILVIPVEKLLP